MTSQLRKWTLRWKVWNWSKNALLGTYRTPGVYFEWQDSVPPQIGIPRTDTAGFVGIAARGPLHIAVKINSWTQFATVFGAHIPQGYLAYAVEGFFVNGGRTCWVVRIADPSKAIAAKSQLPDKKGRVEVRATSPGVWANNARVRPVVRDGSVDAISILLTDGTEVMVRSADFKELEDRTPARDSSDNLLLVASELLEPDFQKLFEVARLEGPSSPALPADVSLTGGSDGLEQLKPEHYSDEIRGFGLTALKDISEISIVAIPDLMPKLWLVPERKVSTQDCINLGPIQTPPADVADPVFAPNLKVEEIFDLQAIMLADCYQRRYRFAVLDTPSGVVTSDQAIQYLKGFPRSDATSSFAALYFPQILVTDPLRLGGLTRTIPVSGHIAGVYARVDRTRGVHKPPANEVVEGAADTKVAIDESTHGDLNSANVNAVRDTAGRGIRVMGARTLETGILLRFVNVRRLLSMIERALESQLQWTVHEPNSDTLWDNIERVVRAFLERLFQLGMLDGATSDDAYSVRCDAKTNRGVSDEGKAICIIGVQPPYPAEFVVVRIGVTRNGIQVEERGSQHA
jgi:phage tail sheath protein FI